MTTRNFIQRSVRMPINEETGQTGKVISILKHNRRALEMLLDGKEVTNVKEQALLIMVLYSAIIRIPAQIKVIRKNTSSTLNTDTIGRKTTGVPL